MKHEYRWRLVALLLVCLGFTGCRQAASNAGEDEGGPAKVEHLEGAQPARVTLTEGAMQRVDIKTDKIREMTIDGALRKVIPYAAVLYDTKGDTWTYTNPAPRVFLRNHITVERIAGDWAVLADGPSIGTAVVTVGAAELYGAESEFEEE